MQDVWWTGGPDETRRLTFALAFGRRVWVCGFFCDGTYDSLLEGRPDAEMNRRIVEEALAKAQALFHEAPHLIEPELREDAKGTRWLPPVRYIADLMSTPVDAQRHGSALVVVWFGTPSFDRPLREVVPAALGSIAWEQHCRDFEF
jgi:hypothetical protein